MKTASIVAIAIATIIGLCGAIDVDQITHKDTNKMIDIHEANSSIFKLIEKDGNVSKNNTFELIQGLSQPIGLPNSTYEWLNKEPNAL